MSDDQSKLRSITLIEGAQALAIGGSDPSGGAGVQADLKTFQRLGVYGATAVTLLTVQNTVGVKAVQTLDPKFVLDQIDAVLEDVDITAIKTGALGNAAIVKAVADRSQTFQVPLVVDPVMVSKHGHRLIEDEAIELIQKRLLKNAFIVTPNRFEAQRLTGLNLDTEEQVAKAIHDLHAMGAKYVLLKLGEKQGQSIHILGDGQKNLSIATPRLDSKSTHGSGCILAASIAGRLARGQSVEKAIDQSIDEVWQAIYLGTKVGSGFHPVQFQAIGQENQGS
jgi:hydroxymethylpyrimidine/phosphomethylpyrimidine kinase